MRLTIFFVLLAGFCSCRQTLSVPENSSQSATAQDFFWQTNDLDTGLDYYVFRNNAGSNHLLSSQNGAEIEDGTLHTVTLVVHSSADSISIDSMGSGSIFSLPAGYAIGTDSTAGSLLILLNSKLDSGDTWYAGNLIGPGIQSGVPVIGRVLNRLDSLIVPPPPASSLNQFGESIQIQYSPIIEGDTLNPPIYWLAYYSIGVGPVRIEEYSPTDTNYAQIVSR